MDFDDVCDELYGLDPAGFVAARKEHVSAARAAGDPALAARIGQLRKPTVAAWVVNVLAREAPDEVGALLDLGAALQAAQRHLSGDDLRTLSGQRQKAVSGLARRAGALAADRGRAADESVLREVAQTLNAALADPMVAAQVRSGTTVTAQTYDGFGPSGLTAVPDVAAAAPEPERPKPRRPSRADRLAAARADLDSANSAAVTAHDAVEAAGAEVARAREAVDEIDARITELREQLDAAEEQRQFARTAERAAAEDARRAERDLEHAERRVAKAQSAVGDLAD